jgi:hypothetical protein
MRQSAGLHRLQRVLIDPDEAGREQGETEALYRLLEEQIVLVFYERDDKGVPGRWLDCREAEHRYGRASVLCAADGETVRRLDIRAVGQGESRWASHLGRGRE